MKISVLGAGRWGTFIAWYLNRIGNDVTVYGRSTSESFLKLKETRSNDYVTLPESVKFSFDLDESVSEADVTVISVGAQNLRSLLQNMGEYKKQKTFVLCMKGIECDTGKRLTEVAIEEGVDKNKVAVWVGPGHIQEFVREKPNCMVIDSYSEELTKFIADSFRSDLIRFYYGDDVIGSEVGAAAKNVLGIAAGVLDGLGLETLKGALMARGAREVSRLIAAMGGNP
ncbi:MAG TPA: glycerol-3-phosphate dehydrogenase, partial [Clostridiales bacterium]|nr:glycerol-3-phosphate dehydrogenase [Clostridiales bacterium]